MPSLRRRFGPEIQGQLSGLLAFSVHQLHRLNLFLNGRTEQLGPPATHPGGVVDKRGLPISKLGFPLAAFACLQAVAIVQLYQRASGKQFIQQLRQLAA